MKGSERVRDSDCADEDKPENPRVGIAEVVRLHHAALDEARPEAAPDQETHGRIHAGKVAELKQANTALEVASRFAFDDVIDPADTRWYIAGTLKRLPAPAPRRHRKHPVDAMQAPPLS